MDKLKPLLNLLSVTELADFKTSLRNRCRKSSKLKLAILKIREYPDTDQFKNSVISKYTITENHYYQIRKRIVDDLESFILSAEKSPSTRRQVFDVCELLHHSINQMQLELAKKYLRVLKSIISESQLHQFDSLYEFSFRRVEAFFDQRFLEFTQERSISNEPLPPYGAFHENSSLLRISSQLGLHGSFMAIKMFDGDPSLFEYETPNCDRNLMPEVKVAQLILSSYGLVWKSRFRETCDKLNMAHKTLCLRPGKLSLFSLHSKYVYWLMLVMQDRAREAFQDALSFYDKGNEITDEHFIREKWAVMCNLALASGRHNDALEYYEHYKQISKNTAIQVPILVDQFFEMLAKEGEIKNVSVQSSDIYPESLRDGFRKFWEATNQYLYFNQPYKEEETIEFLRNVRLSHHQIPQQITIYSVTLNWMYYHMSDRKIFSEPFGLNPISKGFERAATDFPSELIHTRQ